MTVEPKYTDYEESSDKNISISNVQKHNWKSVNSRDFWQPVLSEIPKIWEEVLFNALSQDQYNLKVLELSTEKNDLEELLKKTHDLDLSINKSENVIQVSESNEVIKELNNLGNSQKDKIKKLKLKGYPECCAESKVKLEEKEIHDPIYESACATPSADKVEGSREEVIVRDPHPLLNVMWSYMNWQIINYYPCSFECENSVEIAEKNFEIMKNLGYESEAERLSGFLNSPMSWSGYHGLAHVKNGFSVGEYTTDDRWSEKKVIWIEEHPPKAL